MIYTLWLIYLFHNTNVNNIQDIIDPAMLRPGRLDKLLYVELPTSSGRYEILKTLTKRTPLDNDVSLIKIAEDERCTDFR